MLLHLLILASNSLWMFWNIEHIISRPPKDTSASSMYNLCCYLFWKIYRILWILGICIAEITTGIAAESHRGVWSVGSCCSATLPSDYHERSAIRNTTWLIWPQLSPECRQTQQHQPAGEWTVPQPPGILLLSHSCQSWLTILPNCYSGRLLFLST